MIKCLKWLLESMVTVLLLPSPWSMANERLIAHAGGAVSGAIYTNSLQALNESYRAGLRLMEIDLEWTTDGTLVLLHDWGPVYAHLFRSKIPQWHPLILLRMGARRSRQEFEAATLSSNLTQLTAPGLLRWLDKHSDVRVITDVKSDNIAALKWLALQPKRHQFIPQLHVPDDLVAATQLGYSGILTLYRSTYSDDETQRLCQILRPLAVTLPWKRALHGSLVRRLRSLGIATLAHTVNDEPTLLKLFQLGVVAVYSDSIRPKPELHNLAGAWMPERVSLAVTRPGR